MKKIMKPLTLIIFYMMMPIFSQAQWTLRGSDIDAEAAGDNFGSSVALSSNGNTLAVGAIVNNSSSGHVRIYDWDGTDWVKRGSDIEGEASFDFSGWSVALSSDGNTVAIGSPNNDENGQNAGQAQVYHWDGTDWVKRGSDIEGEAIDDEAGKSVALSSDGNTIVVGAPGAFDGSTIPGQARVYAWDGTDWVKRGNDIIGEGVDDRFGTFVSLSNDGNTVAIGGPLNDGSFADAGHARVYNWDGTGWIQKGQDLDGERDSDQFGWAIDLSDNGNVVAVSAWRNDGASGTDFIAGHVRVFDWNGMTWVQRGEDIDGEAANDWSGYSLSLSGDGNIVAIGAQLNDGSFTNAGHVRVYVWDGTNWTQQGTDIDGEAEEDYSGRKVALSSDGSTVAIGAVLNDGTGTDAGHVRVYSISEINLLQGSTNMASGETYDFGDITENTSSSDISFRIESIGLGNLTLTGTEGNLIILGGADANQFSMNQGNISSPIGGGNNQAFTVKFTPTSLGTKNATLTISNSDSDEGNYIINLLGNAIPPPPEIEISINNRTLSVNETLDLGAVALNSPYELSFLVRNTGGSDLILNNITNKGDFAYVDSRTLTIMKGETKDVKLTLNTSSLGSKSGILAFATNDSDESFFELNLEASITLEAPSNLLGIADSDNEKVGCSWEDNTDFEIAYEVWFALNSDEDEDFTRVGVLPPDSTTFLMPAQSPSRTHVFKVRALGPDSIPSLWANNFAIAITSYTLGLESASESDKIKVYPNPVHDLLQIEINTPEDIKIWVYNMNGKLLHCRDVLSYASTEWNMQDYPSGQYIFLFQIGNKWYQEKVLKE